MTPVVKQPDTTGDKDKQTKPAANVDKTVTETKKDPASVDKTATEKKDETKKETNTVKPAV